MCIRDRYFRENVREDSINPEDLFQAMEGLVYNLNMMYSRMGAQVPMSTINLGLDVSDVGRMVTDALLSAIEKGLGRGETPLFPWVVFHVKEGINFNPADPNYNLYRKAIKVACRRMNPCFAFLDAPVNVHEKEVSYWGDGSRAASSMKGAVNGEPWGWGNIAQVTINLPRIAFKIAHKRKDFLMSSFHNEIKRTVDLCARQLLHRKDVVSNLRVAELPFIMGEKIYKGTEHLAPDESIYSALMNGTLAIGFVGLAEALYIMYGRDHSENVEQIKIGLETADFIKKAVKEAAEEFEANFVFTASSSGYAAQRFAQLDRIEFGITPKVNDKKYYTQGFSLPAGEKMEWTKKLEIEGEYHNRIPGGHFTFLESENMPDEATYEKVLRKMHDAGIAFGGVSFPLIESLETGMVIKDPAVASGRMRTIRRAAGLLLPIDRINDALKQEVGHRQFDL